MQLIDTENPFVKFLASCGQKHLLSNVPSHARQSVYGQCRHLDQYWVKPQNLYNNINTIYIISLDGIGSKELYQLWENNKYTCTPLISEEFLSEHTTILFDNSAEGFCDQYMFKFLSQVVHHYKLNPQRTFYCNSTENITEIQNKTPYTNFKTFCSSNFLEDSMAELYESLNYDFVEDDKLFDIESNLQKQFLYSCLNNAPKHHRVLLLGCLAQKDLLQDGYVSSPDIPFEELFEKTITDLQTDLLNKTISKPEFLQALEWIDCLQSVYPISADDRNEDSIHMKQFGDESFMNNMLNCDIQVITETFANNNLFVSEKIFKPIVMCQPFLILGSTNTYKHLEDLGYKTFNYLINTKELDTSSNIIQKITAICNTIQQLKDIKQQPIEWKQLNDKMAVDIIQNYNHFVGRLNKIKQQSSLGLQEFFEIRPGYRLPLTTQ